MNFLIYRSILQKYFCTENIFTCTILYKVYFEPKQNMNQYKVGVGSSVLNDFQNYQRFLKLQREKSNSFKDGILCLHYVSCQNHIEMYRK